LSKRSEKIQLSFYREQRNGLLRFARNDARDKFVVFTLAHAEWVDLNKEGGMRAARSASLFGPTGSWVLPLPAAGA
jgi:hypothetical protein